MKKLTTVSAIVDELGGSSHVARMLSAPPSAVSNWRRDGLFPANTYLAIRQALKAARLSAPDSLWPMRKLAQGVKS